MKFFKVAARYLANNGCGAILIWIHPQHIVTMASVGLECCC